MARELRQPPLGVRLRPARADDLDQWLALYEAVATEGRWIGGEAPVDREAASRRFLQLVEEKGPAIQLVAELDGRLLGEVGVRLERGVAGLGMLVANAWRGRGVGSSLLEAAVEWAKGAGAHKVALQVWPHNMAARRLYTKFGFAEEGRRRRHYRRRNGELWDAIDMALIIDVTSPGSVLEETGGP